MSAAARRYTRHVRAKKPAAAPAQPIVFLRQLLSYPYTPPSTSAARNGCNNRSAPRRRRNWLEASRGVPFRETAHARCAVSLCDAIIRRSLSLSEKSRTSIAYRLYTRIARRSYCYAGAKLGVGYRVIAGAAGGRARNELHCHDVENFTSESLPRSCQPPARPSLLHIKPAFLHRVLRIAMREQL